MKITLTRVKVVLAFLEQEKEFVFVLSIFPVKKEW